ncbi:MAG: ribonuclease H family protein, partial [candidate division NC10 bacterium]
VEETKFLGLIFDKKLNFIPHIKYVKKKCQKALDLLRVVANTEWGGDQKTLLSIYHALVRSKLDYGSMVYGSARPSYIQMLNPVQNQGLRLCLGAFRTSPADSLAVEADEMPLALRREKLALQYATKVASNPDNPAYECIFHPNYVDLFEKKPSAIPTFGIRIQENMSMLDNFKPEKIAKFKYPVTPPWIYRPAHVNLALAEFKKSETDPNVYISEYKNIKHIHNGYEFIYTDGSCCNTKAAAAAIKGSHSYVERLPDHASIYSAELHAIYLALDHVETSEGKKFVIFVDSKSVLQALEKKDWQNPLVQKILERHSWLCGEGQKKIVFCWIPSHIGIKGNEAADKAAKDGLDKAVTQMSIPYTDYKMYITRLVRFKWQGEWAPKFDNKLNEVHPNIGKWNCGYQCSRKEQSVLSRIRIGHSHLTHCYLLKGEDAPECISCACQLTVKHILIECAEFDETREQYFNVNCLQDLFDKVQPHLILSFLRDIDLFNRF